MCFIVKICGIWEFGAFLITELAVFCSVIWRSSVWEDGAFLFGNLAKIEDLSGKTCVCHKNAVPLQSNRDVACFSKLSNR